MSQKRRKVTLLRKDAYRIREGIVHPDHCAKHRTDEYVAYRDRVACERHTLGMGRTNGKMSKDIRRDLDALPQYGHFLAFRKERTAT